MVVTLFWRSADTRVAITRIVGVGLQDRVSGAGWRGGWGGRRRGVEGALGLGVV